MRRGAADTSVIFVLLLALTASVAGAQNLLEIDINRYEAPGGGVLHSIFFEADKAAAITCELETPIGTYTCTNAGGRFDPGLDFLFDHMDLGFAGLQAAISTPWTLTWDAGPTQTVATIDFGTIVESDFLAIPTITAPLNAEPIMIPGNVNPPTIEWNYGPVLPCDAQPDHADVVLLDQPNPWDAGTWITSGELPCGTTSWSPSSPLPDGTWFVFVLNTIAFRDVPIGITVVEGSWTLENSDWLQLSSIDKFDDTVPTRTSTWGGLKTRYE